MLISLNLSFVVVERLNLKDKQLLVNHQAITLISKSWYLFSINAQAVYAMELSS